MQYEYILMVIPIIIIVAFLVVIAKRMTDGERPDISGAVLGTIIIAVGLLVMVPIISSVDPQFEYDDEDKTFTLYKNVTGSEFSWGSAANAESLIIEDTVTTISAGAFASFSNLKYISIPESLETIGEGAFPTLKDYLDQTITEPTAGEYVGYSGTLYLCDPSIFAISSVGNISGLASGVSDVVNLVIPVEAGGKVIAGFANSAFESNLTIQRVLVLPEDYSMSFCGANVFHNCTALTYAELPDSLTSLGYRTFQGASNLASIRLPASLETMAGQVFGLCTALTTIDLGKTSSIGSNAFSGCSGLESMHLSADVDDLKDQAFYGCTGVTEVSFDSGFAPTTLNSTAFLSWTFYDSDGTTQLDKTDATALAGFTFQGTASALVKVLPDRSTLTAAQTLQVQELTRTAAMTLKLEESELQISEKAELAEA